ncbi:hypothetical protein GCM10018954_029290 [Kutzneria kofuensis]
MTCEHTYSDAVTGYVRAFRDNRLYLSTLDGSAVVARLAATTAVEALRNLGEPYQDVSGRLAEHLVPGRMVSCYGLFYPTAGTRLVHASRVIVIDGEDGVPRFEHPQWWVDQIRGIAGFYRHAQFGDGPVDFTRYRTELSRTGSSAGNHVQETDTISRLVYGMASAYMLSGDQSYLDVAEAGSHYLRERLRFVDEDNDVVYWYHGTEVRDGVPSRKLFTSEFGDDYEAVPAYEQIYALCGLVQTFRVTGDPRLLADIEGTVRLFQEHFADKSRGGYFSHVDPYQLSPHAESLGPNRSRKNWNSVGDHAPAYLFNLWLATGEQRYRDMLEHTFDMIVSHFWPDRSSPFVQERFPRRLVARHVVGLAAEPGRGGAQPEDRVEPDADELGAGQARIPQAGPSARRRHAGPGAGSAARRLVRHARADRRGRPAHLRLARPQGVVAAGAGNTGLHPAGRRGWRRERSQARPRGGGVLQRLLPRPRRRRGVLQRAGQRGSVHARH